MTAAAGDAESPEDDLGPRRVVAGLELWELDALQAARALHRAFFRVGVDPLELRALEAELVRLVTIRK